MFYVDKSNVTISFVISLGLVDKLIHELMLKGWVQNEDHNSPFAASVKGPSNGIVLQRIKTTK